VSESGYYDSSTRPPSARSLRQVWLTDQIQARASGFVRHLRLPPGTRRATPRAGHRSRPRRRGEMRMRRAGRPVYPAANGAGSCTTRRSRLTSSTATSSGTGPTSFAPTSPNTRPARQALLRSRARRVLPPGRGLVDRREPDRRARHQRPEHGHRQPQPQSSAGPGRSTMIHSDHGVQGELNRSSQHLVIAEVFDGSTSAAGGSGSATGDALAGPADAGAARGTRVVAVDRAG